MKVDFPGKTRNSFGLLWLIVISAVFSAVALLGAQIIENPAKPQAANAGRIVTPKEILSIEDSGEKYYFKYPNTLKISPDGSVFLIDENQFLQFDKAGKFLRNLFKKRQGPGEMTRMQDYTFVGGSTVAFSNYPSKMVWFDNSGKYIKNVTLAPKNGILRFHGKIGIRWIFENFEFPRHSGDPAYLDQPYQLLAWEEATNGWTPLSAFPVQIFVVPSAGGSSGFFNIGDFIAVAIGDRFIAISHTPEYLIKIFDIGTNKVVRSFRRGYVRVPPPPLKPGQSRGSISLNGKTYQAPEVKFANDICNVLSRGGRLWIITSTVDKKKGNVVDVFDFEGNYRDSFYLNLPESAIRAARDSATSTLTEDALFTIVRNEEGTFAIKKYKIGE